MLFVRLIITIENHEILLQPDSTTHNRGMVTINGVQQPAHQDGIIYESNAINILRCGGYPINSIFKNIWSQNTSGCLK